MNIGELIIPGVITGIFSVAVALISVWWRDYLEKRKRDKVYNEAVSENDLVEMIEIQRWLDELRKEYDVDRAAIYQFHNGGYFASGASIKKFTMTYESTRPGIASIKRSSQNMLASEHPKWVEKMFKEEFFVCDFNETSDEKARDDMEHYGIKKSVTVAVRDITNHLVGFIALHSIIADRNFYELEHDLIEYSTEISGYLVKKR